jgi:SAM-dependent methyltransferase
MADKHFFEQKKHTTSYLIPYFEKNIPDYKNKKVLEVGCAEGGFVDELQNMGMDVMGLEIEQGRVKIANEKNPDLNILCADITDSNVVSKIEKKFDFIVMRDTIEHIPDRHSTFKNISGMLNEGGYLYITFPPRFSGFAGHQQNCRSLLKVLPYLHLLPDFLIRFIGKVLNENPARIKGVINNYKIGLSINAFEKYFKEYGFSPIVKDLFLLRPIYKIRFGVNAVKVPNIPLFRELFAFGCEYLLIKK